MKEKYPLKIDAYSHIAPKKYKETLTKTAPKLAAYMLEPFAPLYDLDERFRIMDRYEGLVQVLTPSWPAVEFWAAALICGWTTILRGALPMGIVAVTSPLAISTTETSFEASFVTQAVVPWELIAIQWGILPTAATLMTAFTFVSMMDNWPGPWLTTNASCPSGVNSGW